MPSSPRPLAPIVALALAALACREPNPLYRAVAADAGLDAAAGSPAFAGAPATGGSGTGGSVAGGGGAIVAGGDGGLVGYWRFEDGPGSSTAADSSGKGQTGLLVGLAPQTAWVADRGGQALEWVAGTTGGVRIQPGPALAALSDAFTISAWVRRDGATANTYQSIVSRQCGAGPDESYNVALSGGHVLLFLMCGSAHMTLRAPNAAPDHTWIHVVATFDATSVRLYVDNVLFAIAPPDVPSIIHDDHPVLIGNNENGSDPDEPFQGRIDDVAIWNRALSAYQVGLLYNGADPLTL